MSLSLSASKTRGENVFDFINYSAMLFFMLTVLLPFVYLFFESLTPAGYMTRVNFDNLSLENYRYVATNKFIWQGYYNTAIRLVGMVSLGLLVTIVGAYCLSKRQFPNRTFWTLFVVFTMFFSGGMIPKFLVVLGIGMVNSRWALVLPSLINTFFMIIMRNFFMQVPAEIEESAKIDGANNLVILFRLIVPISAPVIFTVGLWIAVATWNEWFESLIYITDPDKFVVQVILRRIVLEGSTQMMEVASQYAYDADAEVTPNPEGLKAAAIFFTTLPILCVYPFIQKHFVKGVIVGSLKG